MTSSPDIAQLGRPHKWAILGISTWAQASSAVAISGPAFLIPALRRDYGLSLPQAATLVTATIAGVLVTLYAWGNLADAWGERKALLLGVGSTLAASSCALLSIGPITLGLALFASGLAAASTSAASGRLVVGWFSARRRGVAMGVRHMSQPLGLAIGAMTMASIADRWGINAAFWVPLLASASALALTYLLVIDPPRVDAHIDAAANPYRADAFLVRIHTASALLVIPQFVIWTFVLAWLVQERHWSTDLAGVVVGFMHLLGAFGRIGSGYLSDAVGSRVRPLRWIAIASAVSLFLVAALENTPVAVGLLVIASIITVSDNSVAYVSVAERAGPFWSGRAMGLQNSGQYLVATLAAPLAGIAISAWGYPATFAIVALAPALAIVLIPTRDGLVTHE